MLNKPSITVESKIYSILLEYPDTNFLSVQLAYSLEEAFILAKLELEDLEKKIFPEIQKVPSRGNPKIVLFAVKSSKELESTVSLSDIIEKNKKEQKNFQNSVEIIQGNKNKEVKETKTIKDEKNELMKRIIETKDKVLLKNNLAIFTKAEIAYLKERIK